MYCIQFFFLERIFSKKFSILMNSTYYSRCCYGDTNGSQRYHSVKIYRMLGHSNICWQDCSRLTLSSTNFYVAPPTQIMEKSELLVHVALLLHVTSFTSAEIREAIGLVFFLKLSFLFVQIVFINDISNDISISDCGS